MKSPIQEGGWGGTVEENSVTDMKTHQQQVLTYGVLLCTGPKLPHKVYKKTVLHVCKKKATKSIQTS